jgi:hypothetical protein
MYLDGTAPPVPPERRSAFSNVAILIQTARKSKSCDPETSLFPVCSFPSHWGKRNNLTETPRHGVFLCLLRAGRGKRRNSRPLRSRRKDAKGKEKVHRSRLDDPCLSLRAPRLRCVRPPLVYRDQLPLAGTNPRNSSTFKPVQRNLISQRLQGTKVFFACSVPP